MKFIKGYLVFFLIVATLAIPVSVAAYCHIQTATNCANSQCQARFINTAAVVGYNVVLQNATQALCSPAGTNALLAGQNLMVQGTRTAGATAPVCQWQCMDSPGNQPIVRFDLADAGFPVELMDFSVE